jgi:dihydrofolate reductase
MISIIVAVAENNGIGKDNNLLFHIPEDLKRFKKLTSGHCVIMGKKTWESLPLKPLPGRKNIVLTDDPLECIDCSITAYSIEDAIYKCGVDEEIFIIGGGSIYRQFLPLADRLYITHVHKKSEADTFFPEIDHRIWEPIENEEHKSDKKDDLSYNYIIYQRRVVNL